MYKQHLKTKPNLMNIKTSTYIL